MKQISITTIIVAMVLFAAADARAQMADANVGYRLLHKLESRSDGGVAVFLRVTNLSRSEAQVRTFVYKVSYCADRDCSQGSEKLSPTKWPDGEGTEGGGSSGTMYFKGGETKILRQDFYGQASQGVGIFIFSKPGFYKIQAAESLTMGKRDPWSNELQLRLAEDGSWSWVDADSKED